MDPLTPDDIAEVIVFSATRRENVVIADTLIFPQHQVRSSLHVRPARIGELTANREEPEPCTESHEKACLVLREGEQRSRWRKAKVSSINATRCSARFLDDSICLRVCIIPEEVSDRLVAMKYKLFCLTRHGRVAVCAVHYSVEDVRLCIVI